MCEVCTEAVHAAEPENDHSFSHAFGKKRFKTCVAKRKMFVSGKKNAANVCCQAPNVVKMT